MRKTTVTAFVQPNVQTLERGLRTSLCLAINIDGGITVELSDLDFSLPKGVTYYVKFRSYHRDGISAGIEQGSQKHSRPESVVCDPGVLNGPDPF